MKVIKFSSHRMRERGLGVIKGMGDGPEPLALYSWDRDTGQGAYLVTDAQAERALKSTGYVGKSRPTLLRRPFDDLQVCWGDFRLTVEQMEWLKEQREQTK